MLSCIFLVAFLSLNAISANFIGQIEHAVLAIVPAVLFLSKNLDGGESEMRIRGILGEEKIHLPYFCIFF